jgi:TP901 family phage tail tape measure protein
MAGTPMQVIANYIANTASFKKGIADVNRSLGQNVKATNSTVTAQKVLEAQNKQVANSFDKVTAAAKRAGNASKNAGRQGSMRQLARGETGVLEGAFKPGSHLIDKRYLQSISGYREAVYRLRQEAKSTRAQMNGLRTTFDDVRMSAVRNRFEMNLLGRTLDNMGKNVVNMGKNAQWTGRQMMVGITAPIVGIGAMSIKSATEVGVLDREIRRLYEGGQAGLDALDAQSRKLSEQWGVARVEIKKTQALFAQAGFNEEIDDLTEYATKFAALGDFDVTEAANMVRVLRTIGVTGTDLEGTLSRLDHISDDTSISLEQMASALPKVAPYFKLAGASIEETAALLTGFTAQGIDADEASRALRGSLNKLSSGLALLESGGGDSNRRLKALIESLEAVRSTGVEIDFRKANGELSKPLDMFKALAAGYNELKRAGRDAEAQLVLRDLFGSDQIGRGSALLQELMGAMDETTAKGSELKRALDIAGRANADAIERWSQQAGMFLGDPTTKMQGQIQKLINSAQELGKKLIPVATDIIAFIGKIVDKFENASPAVQKFIGIFLAGLAALGPVVYIAGQGMIAFGTIFRGLLMPFRDFFKMKGRFRDMFQGSEDAANDIRNIHNEFMRTGDRDKFLNDLDDAFVRIRRGVTAEEEAAGAAKAHGTASKQAAAGINAEAAAQERLNAANSRYTAGPRGVDGRRRFTPITSGGLDEPDIDMGPIQARGREKAMSQLASEHVTRRMSSDAFQQDPRVAEQFLNNFSIMGARSGISLDESVQRMNIGPELKDIASRRAATVAEIASSTDVVFVESKRAELKALEAVEKRMRAFEKYFNRAAPVETVEEFKEFEARVISAMRENELDTRRRPGSASLREAIESGTRSGDDEVVRDLFDQIGADMRAGKLRHAVDVPEDIFDGVLPRSGKGKRTPEFSGMGKALAHAQKIREGQSGDIPLPVTDKLVKQLIGPLTAGPDLEMRDVREQELVEKVRSELERQRDTDKIGSDTYDHATRTRTPGVPGKGLKGQSKMSSQTKDTLSRILGTLPNDEYMEGILDTNYFRGAQDAYNKKLAKLRSKRVAKISELQSKIATATGIEKNVDLSEAEKNALRKSLGIRKDTIERATTQIAKLEQEMLDLDENWRKQARTAARKWTQSVEGGAAKRALGSKDGGGVLSDSELVDDDRNKQYYESGKWADQFLGTSNDEELLNRMGFGGDPEVDPIDPRVISDMKAQMVADGEKRVASAKKTIAQLEGLPEAKRKATHAGDLALAKAVLKAQQEDLDAIPSLKRLGERESGKALEVARTRRQAKLLEQLKAGMVGNLTDSGIADTIKREGIPQQYRAAVTAAVWGRADDLEVSRLLKDSLGDAYTDEDRALTYAISKAINDSIEGARPVDSEEFERKARRAMGRADAKAARAVTPSRQMMATAGNQGETARLDAAFDRAQADVRNSEKALADAKKKANQLTESRRAIDKEVKAFAASRDDDLKTMQNIFEMEGDELGLYKEEDRRGKTKSIRSRLAKNAGLQRIEEMRAGISEERDVATREIRALKDRENEILRLRQQVAEARGIGDPTIRRERFLARQEGGDIDLLGDTFRFDKDTSLDDMMEAAEARLAAENRELQSVRGKLKRRGSKVSALDEAAEALMVQRETARKFALGSDNKYAKLLDIEDEMDEHAATTRRQLTELEGRQRSAAKAESDAAERVGRIQTQRDAAVGSRAKIINAFDRGTLSTGTASNLDALRDVMASSKRGPGGHILPGGKKDLGKMVGALDEGWAQAMSEIAVLQVEDIGETREILLRNVAGMTDEMADEAAEVARDVGRQMRSQLDEVDRLFGEELGRQMRDIEMLPDTRTVKTKKGPAQTIATGRPVETDQTIQHLGRDPSRAQHAGKFADPASMAVDDADNYTSRRAHEMSNVVRGRSKVRDDIAARIVTAERELVDAEKSRNRALKNAKQRALRALQKEAVEAQGLYDQAVADLLAFRSFKEGAPVIVTDKTGEQRIFATTDDYIAHVEDEGRVIAQNSDRLDELTSQNVQTELDAIESERIKQETLRKKVEAAREKEIKDRTEANARQQNRSKRARALLTGGSYADIDKEGLAAMHAADFDMGRPSRNYSAKQLKEFQRRQSAANMFSMMGGGGYVDFDMDEKRKVPRSRAGAIVDAGMHPLRTTRRAVSEVADVAKHPVKNLKEVGKATTKVAKKVPKGTLLDAASWLNPLKPMNVFIKKTGQAGKGIGGFFSKAGKGGGALATLFPTMGGGMASVLSAVGPLLPIILLIGGAVALLVMNFKKWYKTAKPGIDKLREAGKKLIDAVLAPIRGLFKKLNEEGDKGGIGNMWENIGKIIGKVAEILGKIINALTPIVSFIMEVVVAAFYNIIQVVKFVVAIFTGDFGDAGDALKNIWNNVWQTFKTIAGSAAKAILSIVFDMIGGMVALLQNALPSSVFGLKIPGLSQIDDALGDIREGLNDVNNSASDAIDNWIGKGTFAAKGKKKAKKDGEDIGKKVQEGVDETGPLEAPEMSPEEAKSTVDGFISAFQNQMRKVVDGWKEAAMDAFDDFAKGQVDALDQKIKAIDEEVKAERLRDQDLDYLRRKEELRNRRRSEMIRYTTDRDLAIYEGRYDDAKQLDYDYQMTLEDLIRDERDLEEDRQRTLTERLRDATRERIEMQKEELNESNNLRREQLQKQLDMMTEYIPRNVAEAERMHAEIQGMMSSFTDGYGKIGSDQAANWGAGWGSAFAAAKTQVAHEAFWAGEEAMKNFAAALGIDPSLVSAGAPPAPSPYAGYTGSTGGSRAPGTGEVMGSGATGLSGYSQSAYRERAWHTGGSIGNTSMSPSDVPATLQTGEYVIQRKAVSRLGQDFLNRLNEGQIERPTFHGGGQVGIAGQAMSQVLQKGINNWMSGAGSLKLQGGKNFTAQQYKNALSEAYGGGGGWSAGSVAGKSIAEIVDSVVQGIHPEFQSRLAAWNASLGNKFNITRGYRTMAQQAYLYDRWMRRVPGQAPAAPPGQSMHNFGLAVDLLPATTSAAERAKGAAFGLRWPMSYEPWHVEPNEAKAWRQNILGGMVPGASGGGDTGGLRLLGGLISGGGDPKTVVRSMLASYGWGIDQWGPLEKLVQGESGWNPLAANPTSSARGLFQKMTSIHGPIEPTVQGQATWGLNYIKSRYGTPGGAYSKWLSRSPHWYHGGGMVFPVPKFHQGNALINKTGLAEVARGERILRPEQGESGNVEVNLNFNGGFFGSDRELEKLQTMLETKVIPKMQRAKGMERRKIKTVVKE